MEVVLAKLGLAAAGDTRVESISGGERKRLAVASEVLTDPAVLVCDEPTSGLDSHMAAAVVRLLAALAGEGRTVLCTIHQPSSQVFAMFDQLLLLAEGRTAYLGPRAAAKDYFRRQGHPCPADFNPADHLVSTLAVEQGAEGEDRRRVIGLCDAFQAAGEGRAVAAAVAGQQQGALAAGGAAPSPYLASWCQQLRALAWRNSLTALQSKMVVRARLLQALVIAVILGTIYFQQNLDQMGIQNINGVLFVILTNVSFGNINLVFTTFLKELPVFEREHFGGMYRADTYFLAKQLVDLPMLILQPLLTLAIVYWMAGLNPDPARFLAACGIVLLCVQVCTSSISMGFVKTILFSKFPPNCHPVPRWWCRWVTSSPAPPPTWTWRWPSAPSSSSPSCSSAASSSTRARCRPGWPGCSTSPGSCTPSRLCW